MPQLRQDEPLQRQLASRLGARQRKKQLAARDALRARVGRYELKDYACELVSIAREGLVRQARTDATGTDETVYLERLSDEVAAGLCPAQRMIEHWEAGAGGQLARLVEYAAYREG